MAYQLAECDRVCLLPRLSLSDLIQISGLVRTICERSTDVMVLAKRDHVRSIRNLYGDIANARFTFVDSWDQLVARTGGESLLAQVEARGYRLVPLPSFREFCPYAMLGLEAALARTAFRLQRNLGEERALLERVKAEVGSVYAVVHDDEGRAIRRDTLIPAGLPIVSVRDPRWRTANIFDWVQVIDNASQFHGIDSCFMALADALDLRARKYCHAYADRATLPRAAMFRDVIVVWG